MRNLGRAAGVLGVIAVWQLFTGCANQAADNRASGGGGSTNGGQGPGGNVAGSGAADFEAFRAALDQKQLPSPDSIDPAGFFAEHYTALPPPACDGALCLHAMLAVAHNFVYDRSWTLLQMAMNTPIDPATVKKAPLELAVVLDNSGSMDGEKLDRAREGAKALVDRLAVGDTLSLLVFSDTAKVLFGPEALTEENRAAIKATIDGIVIEGGTNLYAGLSRGFQTLGDDGDETHLRRVIFLTDGVATAGETEATKILQMAASHTVHHIGLTTIGLGLDADHRLLQQLAERAGGNYYFVAEASDVVEVFAEELAYFTSPLAYDVTLRFDRVAGFLQGPVFGSTMIGLDATGGTLTIPAVYVASRQTAKPNADGERRGGGSALLIELDRGDDSPAVTAATEAATVALSYRLPGATTATTQSATVQYVPATDQAAYYSNPVLRKNVLILNFYVAFHDAALMAPSNRAAARDLLTTFESRITPELIDADADLVDDLAILQQFIAVLTPSH